MPISARNQFPGLVKHVKVGSVTTRVLVQVGEFEIESLITRQSAEEMGLQPGDRVMVTVKSTDVTLRRRPAAANA